MKPLKEFTIPFVGLKIGKHNFDFKISKKFFEFFEYEDFNDVNVDVELELTKKANLLDLDFHVHGTVNVNCDITNEPFNQPVIGDYSLVVKFGEEFNNDDENILILPHGDFEINVAQYIYEYIILAVPAKLVHPGIADGTLKSDILTKLEELSPKDENHKTPSGEIDPRWESLKKLLTDK